MEKTIQEVVAEKISESGDNVKETVISRLVTIEVDNRVNTILQALEIQDKLTKNLQKIDKTDITTYVNGEPIQAMSDSRFQEISKSKQSLDNLNSKIEACLTENSKVSYKNLSDVINKLQNVK
jgi:hypothetical protein